MVGIPSFAPIPPSSIVGGGTFEHPCKKNHEREQRRPNLRFINDSVAFNLFYFFFKIVNFTSIRYPLRQHGGKCPDTFYEDYSAEECGRGYAEGVRLT